MRMVDNEQLTLLSSLKIMRSGEVESEKIRYMRYTSKSCTWTQIHLRLNSGKRQTIEHAHEKFTVLLWQLRVRFWTVGDPWGSSEQRLPTQSSWCTSKMDCVFPYGVCSNICTRPSLACVRNEGTLELVARRLISWAVIEVILVSGVFPNDRVINRKLPRYLDSEYNRQSWTRTWLIW
jgi:hypothetical protein